MSVGSQGVVREFASEIVSMARKLPVYGDKPIFCLGNVTLQCVEITGGVAFEVNNKMAAGENKLIFADIEDASEAAAASQAGEPGSVELQPQIAEGRLVVSDGTSMVATGAAAPSDDGADAAGTEPAVEIPEGQAIYRPQREFVQSMMSPQV